MTSSSEPIEENSELQQNFGFDYDPFKCPLISPDRAEQMEVDKSDADDNEPSPELIFSKHELIGLKSCLKSSSGGLQPAVKRVRFDIIDVSSPEVDIQLHSSAQTDVGLPMNPSASPGPPAPAYRLVTPQKFVCVEAELGEDMASFLNSMKPATPSTSKGTNGIKKKRPITRKVAVNQRPFNGTSDVSANNKQTPPPISSFAERVSSKEFPKQNFLFEKKTELLKKCSKKLKFSHPSQQQKTK
uniref:Uncharacterized protein n=1 Tax=Ditylenchus dipsaci TaxID=166011 RepID=A0A915D4Y2_9BILA